MTDPAIQSAAPAYTPHPFDARGIARRFRHSAIFGALGALEPGEAMRFVNDHDPLPLLDQLRSRFGDHVEIVYRQRDPGAIRSEEHTSELQSLMRISYAVFCLKKKKN